MNEAFQKFREMTNPRVKNQVIQQLGSACEAAITLGLDQCDLKYPKMLDLILELHLLLAYESNPNLDPANTPKDVDIPPDQ